MNKFKVKPIEVQIYHAGKCFICLEPTKEDAYAHYSCCLAYDESKQLKLKELNEKV